MGAPVTASAALDPQSTLIAAAGGLAIDLLHAAPRLADQLASQPGLECTLPESLTALEESQRDHESRIRLLTDGVTQFKVWSGHASGSSSRIAFLALLRTCVGS
jgi:hypothetical protein